jgi:hypothetical protein
MEPDGRRVQRLSDLRLWLGQCPNCRGEPTDFPRAVVGEKLGKFPVWLKRESLKSGGFSGVPNGRRRDRQKS